MPAPQASLNYGNPMVGPYCAMGLNPASTDPMYVQWPTQSMIYAQSYDQLRHGFFQVGLDSSCLLFSSNSETTAFHVEEKSMYCLVLTIDLYEAPALNPRGKHLAIHLTKIASTEYKSILLFGFILAMYVTN